MGHLFRRIMNVYYPFLPLLDTEMSHNVEAHICQLIFLAEKQNFIIQETAFQIVVCKMSAIVVKMCFGGISHHAPWPGIPRVAHFPNAD